MKNVMMLFWVGVLLLVLSPGGALGGVVSIYPPASTSFFGQTLGIEDVNGDGLGDLMIYGESSPGNYGNVFVYSGQDRSLIRTLTSPNAQSYSGFGTWMRRTDNVGGTSGKDVLIGANWETVDGLEGAGRAYFFDPFTGSVLQTLVSPSPTSNGHFSLGVSIEDLNSDGVSDFIVGATGEGTGGRAYILSGATFGVIQTLSSPHPHANGEYGEPLVIPDLDSDGIDDFAISAAGEVVSGKTMAGRVYVYSGATQSLLYTLQSPNPAISGWFGQSCDFVEDLTGDGKADLIVATSESSAGGRAYLFSGADGSLVDTLSNPLGVGAYGGNVAAMPDITGDSVPDIAVGDTSPPGRIVFVSGADRSVIGTLAYPNTYFDSFSIPILVPDVDGDGKQDLVIWDHRVNGYRGCCFLYSSRPDASVSPTSLLMGNRSPSAGAGNPRNVLVKNIGFMPVELNSPRFQLTGADASEFVIASAPTGATLAGGQTATLELQFDPAAGGSKSATLQVFTNDEETPSFEVDLSGVGRGYPIQAMEGTVYIARNTAIFAVDLATGDRQVLSSPAVGSGPPMGLVQGVAIEDGQNLLAIGSGTPNWLFRVDRVTGNRTVLSSSTIGTGVDFGLTSRINQTGEDSTMSSSAMTASAEYTYYARGLVIESPTTVLTCRSYDGVVRIDKQTGDRTQVTSNNVIGSGPTMYSPFGLILENNGDILVADVSGSRIVHVDPSTGDRTQFSYVSGAPYGISRFPDGDFVTSTNGYSLHYHYLSSAANYLFSGGSPLVGTGPSFGDARGVVVRNDGAVFVHDPSLDAVVFVDPNSGDRTILSSGSPSTPIGSGPSFGGVLSLDYGCRMAVTTTDTATRAGGSWICYE